MDHHLEARFHHQYHLQLGLLCTDGRRNTTIENKIVYTTAPIIPVGLGMFVFFLISIITYREHVMALLINLIVLFLHVKLAEEIESNYGVNIHDDCQ